MTHETSDILELIGISLMIVFFIIVIVVVFICERDWYKWKKKNNYKE